MLPGASCGFSTPGLPVARGRVVQRRTRRPPADGGGEGPQRWCCHHRGGWEGANELIHLLLLMLQKSQTTTWDVKKNLVHIGDNISIYLSIFPQIAIAIGVLTSNRGEGDEPLWRIGPGTRVPLQGAVDVVPLLGAIVGCLVCLG